MTNYALADGIALMLTRKFLSGLRGFPTTIPGESLLSRTVQENTLSVEHAESVLAHFDDLCPTPHEIKEVAWNSERARFEPPPKPLKEQWEAAGATYNASFYEQVTKDLERIGQFNTDVELTRAIKQLLHVTDWTKVSWEQIKSAKRFLGFPLNSHEREYADRWDREHPNAYASVEPISAQNRNPRALTTQAIASAEPKPWRCPSCNATGRTDSDAYCGCEIGRDLRRQEQRDQIA